MNFNPEYIICNIRLVGGEVLPVRVCDASINHIEMCMDAGQMDNYDALVSYFANVKLPKKQEGEPEYMSRMRALRMCCR